MKNLRNERGVALITALLLTMISLAIVLAVLYMISQGTQVSAANKRYKNALEAAGGGADVFTKDLIQQIVGASQSSSQLATTFSGISLSFGGYTSCMKMKIGNPKAKWSNTGNVCGPNYATTDPKSSPDVTFNLKGLLPLQPGFNVYAKIVDTVQGNSDISGVDQLDSGSGVAYASSGVSPQHVPSLFSIEVQGERATNPLEKAKLTILYAY
jgi:hypothetical protein